MSREAVARGLVTQTGNEGYPSESIRVFRKMIEAGAIGAVTEVHCGCDAFPEVYCQYAQLAAVRTERPPVPAELDWDLWLGPAPERPYHPAYVPRNWCGWMAFGTGAIGDWVCHVVDPVFWTLDLDLLTAVCAEAMNYDPAEHTDVYPPGSVIAFEFPAKGARGSVTLRWHDGKQRIPRPPKLEPDRQLPGVGAVAIGKPGKFIYGSHGTGGCRLIPEARMESFSPPEKR